MTRTDASSMLGALREAERAAAGPHRAFQKRAASVGREGAKPGDCGRAAPVQDRM